MARLIEVITLASSDEETLSEIDTIETKNGKITVKIEETERLKDSSVSSANSKYGLNSKSILNSNLKEVSSSNSSTKVNKKNTLELPNQTARKSFNLTTSLNLLQIDTNKVLHSKKQPSFTNVKPQKEQENHILNHTPSIEVHKINSSVLSQTCPSEEKEVMEVDLDCDNVISHINKLEKRGFSIDIKTNNSKIINHKQDLKNNYINGTSFQDKKSSKILKKLHTQNENASLDPNVLKSKNISETEKSVPEKRKKEEKSDNELISMNSSKKRKLNKDTQQINEFSKENETSVPSTTINKLENLVISESLDKIASVSKNSLPKFDTNEKILVKNFSDNKYETKHSTSELPSDIHLKVLNASKDGGLLDAGRNQNECLQSKSLFINNNSDSSFKTSNITDTENIGVSNVQIPFSSAVSSDNLINEFEQVRQDSTDLQAQSNELNSTVTKNSEVQVEHQKETSASSKATFTERNNLKCENTINITEDKDSQVHFMQSVQLVPSTSTVEKVVEKPGRLIKEVTSPKLSLKRKRMENPNGVLSSESFEKQLKCMPNDIKSLNDTKRCLLAVENDSLTVTSPPHDENNLIPGPSNRTYFANSNKQKFNLLVEFCMSQDEFNPEEGLKLQIFMNKSISKVVEPYLNSLEFSNHIDSVYAKVKNEPEKVCDFLCEFRKELRAYRKEPNLPKLNVTAFSQSDKKCECNSVNIRTDNLNIQEDFSDRDSLNQDEQSLLNDLTPLLQKPIVTVPVNASDTLNIPEESVPDRDLLNQSEALDLNSLTITNKICLNSNIMNPSKINALDEMAKKKLDRKIVELEKLLEKFDKKIKKLQEKELTLEDMDDEDSAYIQEERYKKKMLKIWCLLCRLKKQSTHLGSEMERKLHFQASRFQEINRKIEKFINKQKVGEKFPDYNKIYDIIKSVNEKVQLGLKESDYPNLAKELFKDVGLILKRRRLNDFEFNLRGFVQDNSKVDDDPADLDEDLKKKLESNAEEGEKKMDNIMNEYASKQEEKSFNKDGVEEENKVSDEGSEEENKVSDEGSEEEDNNYEADSDGEESDVSLETEFKEVDNNLPDTEPSSPASDFNSLFKDPKTDPAVIDIGTESDASTDPGQKALNSIENFPDGVSDWMSTNHNLKSHIESDSSSDLPSL